jgi:hypothetical protein
MERTSTRTVTETVTETETEYVNVPDSSEKGTFGYTTTFARTIAGVTEVSNVQATLTGSENVSSLTNEFDTVTILS